MMNRARDVYAAITEVEPEMVEQVGRAMEVSASDPQHVAMVEAYLSDFDVSPGARVLEIGCGTGAISRLVAGRSGVAEMVGVDPSPILLAKARGLAAGIGNLRFEQADGRELKLPSATFDGVIVHRVLSHVPSPERVLGEAFRVLRPGGRIAVFDGDYATITLATGENDPLQVCVAAFAPAYIHDPWVVRRLLAMVRAAGFAKGRWRSFGYVQIDAPDYMMSIVERGAEALAATGRIGRELTNAFKAEARRRVQEGVFFGHIAYASVTAEKAG